MIARSVAVLADVHGVLPALEAVLAEPDVIAADRVVVCGDLAAGPQPVEVLDRLEALGERAVLVRGNADRELVAMSADPSLDVGDPVASWAATVLQPRHLALLAALPHPVELDVAGLGSVLLHHGGPRRDDEVLLVDTTVERWREALAEVPDRIRTLVGGHTHMPFVRLVDGRLVVVPGSVGMPYGRPGAHWALLADGAVTLRRTRFDAEAAVESIAAASGYPDARAWAESVLLEPAGDAEVLAEFGPRDGRLDRGPRTTARLRIEPIRPHEAARIVARAPAAGDRWHAQYPFEDELGPLAVLARATDPHPVFTLYKVVERATGLALGGIGFFGPPDDGGAVELGYGLVADARGRGYATEALLAAVRLAFDHGARLVRADTEPANAASQRVLTKAGFTPAGTRDGRPLFELHP